ncbi:PREDICTED: uncharacterized protein LOC106806299 [Priapulus caudatus]|uniref:Uncharacterized protein LOC106806299 n=1 Tax=Priapulus caudatus TaxID=37621 RepID=A0ABM1DUQ2_PRICU|nr:PREDICTED: uncharacterized protein LOC106806299 [Priapulus caudatus]
MREKAATQVATGAMLTRYYQGSTTTTATTAAMDAPFPEQDLGDACFYRCLACAECFFTDSQFVSHARRIHCKLLLSRGQNSEPNSAENSEFHYRGFDDESVGAEFLDVAGGRYAAGTSVAPPASLPWLACDRYDDDARHPAAEVRAVTRGDDAFPLIVTSAYSEAPANDANAAVQGAPVIADVRSPMIVETVDSDGDDVVVIDDGSATTTGDGFAGEFLRYVGADDARASNDDEPPDRNPRGLLEFLSSNLVGRRESESQWSLCSVKQEPEAALTEQTPGAECENVFVAAKDRCNAMNRATGEGKSYLAKRKYARGSGKKGMCNICHKVSRKCKCLNVRGFVGADLKPIVCNICCEAFKKSNNLGNHMRVHPINHEYAQWCNICNAPFNHAKALASHMQRWHTLIAESVSEDADSTDFVSTEEDQTRILEDSVSTEEDQIRILEDFVSTGEDQTRILDENCQNCSKRFTPGFELNGLFCTKCEKAKKPYRCHFCSKSFTSKQYLTLHSAAHNKKNQVNSSKVYKCHVCEKEFKYNSWLQAHHATHFKQNRVKKEASCAKTPPLSNTRKSPRNEYMKRSAYTCNVCQKSFTWRRELRSHTTEHLKDRLYKCDICNKEFKYAAWFRAHKLRHKREGGVTGPRESLQHHDEASITADIDLDDEKNEMVDNSIGECGETRYSSLEDTGETQGSNPDERGETTNVDCMPGRSNAASRNGAGVGDKTREDSPVNGNGTTDNALVQVCAVMLDNRFQLREAADSSSTDSSETLTYSPMESCETLSTTPAEDRKSFNYSPVAGLKTTNSGPVDSYTAADIDLDDEKNEMADNSIGECGETKYSSLEDTGEITGSNPDERVETTNVDCVPGRSNAASRNGAGVGDKAREDGPVNGNGATDNALVQVRAVTLDNRFQLREAAGNSSTDSSETLTYSPMESCETLSTTPAEDRKSFNYSPVAGLKTTNSGPVDSYTAADIDLVDGYMPMDSGPIDSHTPTDNDPGVL